MEVIKDTIASVLRGLEKKRSGGPGDDPEFLLRQVLTKKELEHVRIGYFRKGVLGVNVDSSAWLYFLTLNKEKLLVKLNSISSVVKDIRFRLGEVK
jgi:hypothetical protein